MEVPSEEIVMDGIVDLCSEEEMAALLGYSRAWLRAKRLANEGPPYVPLGNRIMYDPSDVWEWVKTIKVDPKTATPQE
jgi:predicted DNA-binding transcriptional regulator AlpA